jgi:lipoprotein NlpD
MARADRLPLRPILGGIIALPLLAACSAPIDVDLRGLGDGFSTAEAALAAAPRPAPDARGIITYPNYQVVVAQQGDTARSIALRLGIDAAALASYNGISADQVLRRDELIALPGPVPAAGAVAPVATDITAVATTALDRAGTVSTAPLPAAAAATAPAQPFVAAGPEPIRHQVQRGETAYSIARLYNVPVETIAAWNSLGPDLAVREGQQLLVPQGGAAASPPSAQSALTQPGAGTPTPVPPSAATPLPEEVPPPAAETGAAEAVEEAPAPSPAPDLGAEQTPVPAAASAYIYPVQGTIIREYSPGRNEGIDIGVPTGTEVRAAAAGTVAAITSSTEGFQIVVIRHADGLLTVYTHLEGLTVAKDQTVSQGQTIGRVKAGDPSFLHFEIREGTASRDPSDYLP